MQLARLHFSAHRRPVPIAKKCNYGASFRYASRIIVTPNSIRFQDVSALSGHEWLLAVILLLVSPDEEDLRGFCSIRMAKALATVLNRFLWSD